MSNPFDQFDAPTAGGNPFDQFDAPKAKQNKGIAGDTITDLKRGIEQIPGIVTGLADIPIAAVTGDTYADKAANVLGDITGFQPSKWAKDAEAEYSPKRRASSMAVDKAWQDNESPFSDAMDGDFSGIGNIAKAYAQNPLHTLGAVVESLPSMAAGGLAGRAAVAASKIAPVVGGAMGEGAVMAGQQMTQLTEAGADPRTAAAASLATGVVGGGIGAMGGKLAQTMGIVDPETVLAGGAVRGVAAEAGDQSIKGMIKEGAKRVAGGAMSEGFFEELPQSVLEQTLSNLAQGKPWDEGVSRAAVEGTLAGSLMGGAFNVLPPSVQAPGQQPPDNQNQNPLLALPAPTYTGTPGDQIIAADSNRQAAIDKAQADADALYAARDAYELEQRRGFPGGVPTITNDPAPIQQRIDALLGINQARLTGIARSNYEKALEAAFNERIGFAVGKDSMEIPVTMGDYLASKVAAGDIDRNSELGQRIALRQNAGQNATNRLQQLADEEAMQQPDIAPIPVVGPISAAANVAVQSGVSALAQAQQVAEQMANQEKPAEQQQESTNPLTAALQQGGISAAVPEQVATQTPQTNDAQAASFDVSKRTDKQLEYLTQHGQPGWKEAAVAELQKRGKPADSESTVALKDSNSANGQQAAYGIPDATAGGSRSAPAATKRNALGLPEGYTFATGKNSRENVSASSLRDGDVIHVDGRIIGVDKVIPKGDGTVDLLLDSVGGKSTYNVSADRQLERRKIVKIDNSSQADSSPVAVNSDEDESAKQEAANNNTPNGDGATSQPPKQQAPAPTEEQKPKKPLSVGVMPGAAEPITVKDGVVYIGKYPAQNFDTGEDVTVPAGATDKQVVTALKDAGAIAGKMRVFGMEKEEVKDAIGWTAMTTVEREGLLHRAGYGGANLRLNLAGTRIARTAWDAMSPVVRDKLTAAYENQFKPADQNQIKNENPSAAKFTEEQKAPEQDPIKNIDAAANEAATSAKNDTPQPTEAQQEAGNYKKGHITVQGLNITIENPEGSKRSGTDEDGKAWEATMAAHYGYIKRTEGNDGDHVDVYVGNDPDSDIAFIVDQSKADGSFDEHKVLLGFTNALSATRAYAKSYEPGWMASRVIAAEKLTVSELKDWLKNGNMSKPYSHVKSGQETKPVLFAELRSRLSALSDRAMNVPGSGALAGRIGGFTVGMKEDSNNLTRQWVNDVVSGYEKQVISAERKYGLSQQKTGTKPELTKENFDIRLDAAKGNLAALVELNKELGRIYGSNKSKENPGGMLASTKTNWAKDAMPKVFAAMREINGKNTEPAQDQAPAIDFEKTFSALGFKKVSQNTYAMSVPTDNGRALFNIKHAGDPVTFAVTKSVTFDNGVTGAPTQHIGRYFTIEDAVEAARATMPAKSEKESGSQSANSEPDADSRFAKNTIFTADKVAAAKARMKAKLGTMNSGIDPELLIDGMTIAGAYIESGVRKFGDYAKAMVADLGEGVKPYLLSFYEAARAYPGLEKSGMDTQESAGKQHQELLAQKQKEQSAGIETAEGKHAVAKELADFFIGGGEFKTIIEARKKIAEMIGKPIDPATELAKQADETIEAAVVIAGREMVAAGRKQGRSSQVIYDRLVSLYQAQPNLAVRSSTSVRDQAYSTPVPLAYLASELAGITAETKVLEPTAGNGMLLVGANVNNAVANELNPKRAAMLEAIGFKTTTENAATSELAPAKSRDAVIANPPFGATKDANGDTIIYSVNPNWDTREVDHAIAFMALDAMKDDGRAVLIVGGSNANSEEGRREDYRGKNKRQFYFNLYNDYNVVDHFTVDGDLYSKQGASYPVDVIVIDGRGKSSRDLPAADLPKVFTSYEALKEKLNDANRMDAGRRISSRVGGGDAAAREGDAQAVAGRPGGQSDRNGTEGGAQRNSASLPDARLAGNAESAGGGGVSGNRKSQSANKPGASNGERVSDAGGKAEDGSAAGNQGDAADGLGGVSVVDGQRVESGLADRRGQEQETENQVAYTPQSGGSSVGTLVPRAMRDSIESSLQRIADQVGNIDEYVAESLDMDPETVRSNFSAEQIDALALSIRNAGAGKGFIIGDQTGIGKGRVVAAMIRYALVNGKVPIFVTEKPNLYSDMIRDLDDIGMTDDLALDTKSPKILITNGSETIPYTLLRNVDGEIVENNLSLKSPKSGKALDDLMRSMVNGDSLGDYRVIFTTYSQLQTVKGNETTRQKFIKHFGESNYMIFDESHNAGGAGEQQARTKEQRQAAKEGQSLVTGRAAFVRNLVQKAFGTFFSSATYAKRPDVMDLYSSTNMKLAVDRISQLGEAIKSGGVPMQQAVANMLTKDGQYIRRERTFAGVAYDTVETTVDKQTAENMANSMRAILAFSRQKDAVIKSMQKEFDRQGAMVAAVGGETTSVQGANFGSIMHNLIDQMLLSLKAKSSVDHAISRLKAGEKVVMTVSNTMGSFLQSYAEDLGLATGDPVALSFADLYERYLEKQRIVSIKTGGGEKKQHRLTDAELGPELVGMYESVRKQIRDSGFGSAPISPIDYMHSELRKAGYKTDEITGRTMVLKYGDNGAPVLTSRSANIKQRVGAVSAFNNGSIDVLILNQAGSTGLSLHASSKVKDQRKRHMIIVQAEKNIDTHMQMLGRVHRTGQVIAPAYSQMMADVPAEMRPASVLLKKMASLNANTTASRKSSVTAEGVVDFMNDYGGQIVHEYLRDNPEVLEAVGGPDVLKLTDDSADGNEDDIRKFTGYIPILPIKQQEEIYRELTERYNDLIERENSLGTNKLEAKAVDLDAETISSLPISESKGEQSVFADQAFMEKVDVKRSVKPYSSQEVAEIIMARLEGSAASLVASEQISDLRKRAVEFAREKVAKMQADGVDPVKIHLVENQITATNNHAHTILNSLRIGDTVSIKDSSGQFLYGAITNISTTGKAANPAAGSAWKMTFALANGDAKSITLNFSQIGSKYEVRSVANADWYNIETQQAERVPVMSLFDKGATVRREKRWMVTGNILAGFSRFPGQIITYTKKDGSSAQGILMSRQFDFEKEMKNAPVTIRSGSDAIRALDGAGSGTIIGSRDKMFQITHRGNRYEVTAPSSKKDGGTYYLDSGITDIVGDFYKRGSVMSATVYERSQVERLVDYLNNERQEAVVAINNTERAKELLGQGGAKVSGNIADGQASLSPADKAVYGMVAEGKSAADILKFIASASRNPFNRQVAKLLLKTGIAPKSMAGTAQGWKFNAGNDKKYAAAYNEKTDTIALFRPAAAERNFLHEAIHAATIRALGRKGMAAGQMKALFAHVQKTGKLKGMYGMSDVDEFIAEAFSNPKFQDALKRVAAPKASGALSSAWNWFVRIVKGILGLPANQESALSQALEIGLGVMREDMAVRRVENLPESAGIAERNDYVNRSIEQWANGELKSGVIIDLGKPSGILKRFGVPDLPINMTQHILNKAVREKHDVEVGDLKDLVVNIQAPIAVFKSKNGDGKIVAVTQARHADGNITVALDLDVTRRGISINDIRSIHPKRDRNITNWIDDGMLLGFDKHSGRDWLENSAQANFGQYPTSAATDGAIIYDGRLIRKAAEAAVIKYAKANGRIDQTDTPEFKKWFGKSAVVDADGRPLVVYHGTNTDFAVFDKERLGNNYNGHGSFGFYFTDEPGSRPWITGDDSASMFARQAEAKNGGNQVVMPVYLSIRNPLVVKSPGSAVIFIDMNEDGLRLRAGRNGNDGIIVKGKDSSVYVAFDPTQIKSAIGNIGTFDGANPDIRYNIADDGAWSVSEPSKMDDVIYALQDKQIDMKRVVQAIKSTGKKIRDNFNPYLQEELFHGRAAKGVKDFLDFELRPLLKEMQDKGVDMGDFEEYLWNRHAEERNKQIAKINTDMPDGGSGIATAEARAYLAGLSAEQKAKYEALAKRVDAMNRGSQKVLVESGLESAETIAAWNGAYQSYVPLQREDVDSGHVGTGKGFSIRGSSSKRAMGSGKKVVDIIANIAMQRERNIVRAEKNRVSNALMGLAMENPNPEFWKVDKAPKERVVNNVAIYNVLDADGNKVADFTNMAEAERMARSLGGDIEQTWGDRVQERIEPGFKNRDNVVLTRVNGKDHYIIFNERDERAMRMAQSLKNLDVDNMGRVLSVVGKATRYLASVNTQYNPVFGVINLIRDAQGAMVNLTSTPLAGDQKKVLGYTVDALRGIYSDIRAHRRGEKPSSNWANLFEEFQKEGGQTGYRDQYANAEARAEAIQSEIEQFKEGNAKQLTRGIFGWLSDYNETMENAVRLAAYKAGKERGLSNQQAASVAKNITVNFNRKGQMATQVGALYAFFNASVQGTARIAETLFEQHGGDMKNVRLSRKGRQIVTGGILLGSMQALLLAAAGYGDDEPPDFVRERNLILPIGDGKYLTLAMPLGFHVIPGTGRIATEFVMSGFKDPLKRMAQFGSMFAEAFNPVGNSGFSLQTITPSVVDPFAALAENKDFTGKEIYREDFNKLNPTPGHTRAKDVASVWSRYISEALNFITGGTEFKPGLFSPSPDSIDYLIGQLTGGVGREANKAAQTIGSGMSGEDLPLYKIPLVGRFIGDTEGQSGQSAKFYDAIKQINMHEAQYKGLIKDGRSAEAREYLAENPAVRLILAGNHAELQVRKLRAMKRDLVEKDAGHDQIRAIDERITTTMRKFNERAGAVI